MITQNTYNDKQLQKIAGSIFGYLKETGMSSVEMVRIVTMLTGNLTDEICDGEHEAAA